MPIIQQGTIEKCCTPLPENDIQGADFVGKAIAVDVSLNDDPCPEGTQTYGAPYDFINISATEIIGTLPNITVTPALSGYWSFKYDVFCDYDGRTVKVGSAYVAGYAKAITADAVDDPSNNGFVGVASTIDASANDVSCNDGGVLTYGAPYNFVNIVAGDIIQTGGSYEVTPSLEGDWSFDYDVFCVVNGVSTLMDTATVSGNAVLVPVGTVTGVEDEGSYSRASFNAATAETTGNMTFTYDTEMSNGTLLDNSCTIEIEVFGTREQDLSSATWASMASVSVPMNTDPSTLTGTNWDKFAPHMNFGASAFAPSDWQAGIPFLLAKKDWASDNSQYWDGAAWTTGFQNSLTGDTSFRNGNIYKSQAVALRFNIKTVCGAKTSNEYEVVFERLTGLLYNLTTDNPLVANTEHRPFAYYNTLQDEFITQQTDTSLSISGASVSHAWGTFTAFNRTKYADLNYTNPPRVEGDMVSGSTVHSDTTTSLSYQRSVEAGNLTGGNNGSVYGVRHSLTGSLDIDGKFVLESDFTGTFNVVVEAYAEILGIGTVAIANGQYQIDGGTAVTLSYPNNLSSGQVLRTNPIALSGVLERVYNFRHQGDVSGSHSRFSSFLSYHEDEYHFNYIY